MKRDLIAALEKLLLLLGGGFGGDASRITTACVVEKSQQFWWGEGEGGRRAFAISQGSTYASIRHCGLAPIWTSGSLRPHQGQFRAYTTLKRPTLKCTACSNLMNLLYERVAPRNIEKSSMDGPIRSDFPSVTPRPFLSTFSAHCWYNSRPESLLEVIL